VVVVVEDLRSLLNSLVSLMFLIKLPIFKRTLSFTQLQDYTLLHIFSQSFNAKFTASAILKPKLKPAWYPEHLEIMNSPSLWMVLVISIPLSTSKPVKKGRLMSNKFWALPGLFWKLRLSKFFKILIAVDIDPIPEFGLSMMKIVNRI